MTISQATLLLESIINPQSLTKTTKIKKEDKYCEAIKTILEEYIKTTEELIDILHQKQDMLNTIERQNMLIEYLQDIIDNLSNNKDIQILKH